MKDKKQQEELVKISKQLRIYCEEGSLTSLKNPLKKYPHLLETVDNKGTTLFGISFKKEQYEVSDFLLSIGADINSLNNVYISQTIIILKIGKSNSSFLGIF